MASRAYVVPEHAFALDMTGLDITMSGEHTDVKWVDPKDAAGELTERLEAGDLPDPATAA